MKEKSKFWNKFWVLVGVFTFIIPIIPYGLLLAWSYFNPTEPAVRVQTTDTRSVNSEDIQVEDDSPSDDINYQPRAPLYFYGDECTEDCSGHEAGYEWADENGIDSIDDCGGNSDSFIEGCESYVEENYQEPDEYSDDYYDEYDDVY